MNIYPKKGIFDVSSIFWYLAPWRFTKNDNGEPRLRKRFEVQYELGATPIEELKIPTKSRDEMPPVLRALQYIYATGELNQKIFEHLASKVTWRQKTNDRSPRAWPCGKYWFWRPFVWHVMPTMTSFIIWLPLTTSYAGCWAPVNSAKKTKEYSLQSIKDNIGLIDDEVLEQVNDFVVEAGHQLVKKKAKS